MEVLVQRRFGFGLFEANLSTRELYRRGALVHVQEQPFRILAMLLERPGQVLSREELLSELWPADTFVEFDEGLNTAISKLRCALGDSSGSPTYIETLPRRGYRFIAPVRVLHDPSDSASHEQAHDAGMYPLPADNPNPNLNGAEPAKQSETPPEPELKLIGRSAKEDTRKIPVSRERTDKNRFWRSWAIAIMVVLALAYGFTYFRTNSTTQRAMYLSVHLPGATRDLTLSHSGQIVAFISPVAKQGGTALWIRDIGAPGARLLENTEGASYPFWSPDDKFIAFFADGKLKRVGVGGGPVQLICDAPVARGGTWNRNGVIVFAPNHGVAMSRVSAAGGPVTLVTGFENKLATTMSYRWPTFLPDGKHFLYTSVDFGADLKGEASGIYVAALDSTEHRRLLTSSANAAYLAPGYILFFRNGTLMGQRFDPERLRLNGGTFAVANEVEYLSSVARALFTVSENGTLVYRSGSGTTFSQLVWFDRDGKQLGTLGAPARYANPRLSPDGTQVAVDIDDPQSSNTDVWVIRTRGQAPFRFTFDPSQDEAPLWSHDSKRILWLSDRDGKNGFYLKASDGSAAQESPTMPVGVDLSFASAPSDWSSDGHFLLYTDLQEGHALHLWVLPMAGDKKPYRFLPGTSADIEGQFSPDGHWVAYSSNESGRWQVYVAPFPVPGGKYQLSTDGGQQPRWRRDGRELFFLSRDRRLMAVSVRGNGTFEFTPPTPLFETQAHEPLTAEEFFTYDVAADGQRFLINSNIEQTDPRPVDIILNWASGIAK